MSRKNSKETLLTPAEAAERLGVSRETLRHWRGTGYGPPMAETKNQKIRYPEGPLQAWIRCHTRFPEGAAYNDPVTAETRSLVA